jgi:hypothetical protein
MIQKSSTVALFAGAAAVIALFATAGVSVSAQAGATRRPDLGGHWQLNRELSDDAREKLKSMGHGPADAHGGGHGPGRHGGFFGIFGGGRAKQMHAQLEEVIVNAPTRFSLAQDEQKVVLTDANGRVQTRLTNNRKVTVAGRDVQTKWESNRLVSEITVGNAKVIETYERSSTAPQLIVTASVDGRGRQVSVRRVYDPVAK